MSQRDREITHGAMDRLFEQLRWRYSFWIECVIEDCQMSFCYLNADYRRSLLTCFTLSRPAHSF
jgi:hypothetical protein